MNPEIIHSSDGMSAISTPGMRDYLPTKGEATPVKSQSSVLYYFSQNQTPLNHVQQFPGIPRNEIMSGSQLKTPVSSCSNRLASHILQNSKTPSSGKTTQRTDVCYNPFEVGLVDILHGPLFSPNVFKTSTPGCAGPVKFQWSIDEIAVLRPVDIEEPCHHDAWSMGGVNSEIEERAQKAIDTYFSSHVIVPSPWTDSTKKKPFVLPATPGGSDFMDSPMIFSTKSAASRVNIHVTPPKLSFDRGNHFCSQIMKKEVGSQTMLTLPVDFNLEVVLKSHYAYLEPDTCATASVARQDGCQDEDDGTNQDVLSNSSLRRKLFFHGVEGTPISPVSRSKSFLDGERSPSPANLSPTNSSHIPLRSSGCGIMESSNFAELSETDCFSSSPIQISHATPTFRRCSTTPFHVDSPSLSPIRSAGCSKTPNRTGHMVQSPDFGPCSFGRNASNYTVTAVSSGSGHGKRNLSTIDDSFDNKKEDGQQSSEEPCTDQVKWSVMGKVNPAEEHQVKSHTESSQMNFDNAAFCFMNAPNPVEEVTSMSQEHAPSDSQNAGLHAVTTDTGYQSNLLQVTSTTSCIGAGCFSTQYDSTMPSMFVEEMSCDSSCMQVDWQLATSADSGAVKSFDNHGNNAVAGDKYLPSSRKFGGIVSLSLGTLHSLEENFQNKSTEKSPTSNLNAWDHSLSQPDILLAYCESL